MRPCVPQDYRMTIHIRSSGDSALSPCPTTSLQPVVRIVRSSAAYAQEVKFVVRDASCTSNNTCATGASTLKGATVRNLCETGVSCVCVLRVRYGMCCEDASLPPRAREPLLTRALAGAATSECRRELCLACCLSLPRFVNLAPSPYLCNALASLSCTPPIR